MCTLVVIIITLSDWITSIPTSCFWVSTIATYGTFGKVVLILVRWCSNMWLPISILCGAECGCAYIFSSLLLTWIDAWICWLFHPNWLPNSMSFNMFWIIRISSSCSYDWSINALATFCNSTCLAIFVWMWKGTKE